MQNDWSKMPIVLTRKHMCELLVCSQRTLTRKLHLGKICRPLNYGEGNNRWLRDEVQKWFETGCPSSETNVQR